MRWGHSHIIIIISLSINDGGERKSLQLRQTIGDVRKRDEQKRPFHSVSRMQKGKMLQGRTDSCPPPNSPKQVTKETQTLLSLCVFGTYRKEDVHKWLTRACCQGHAINPALLSSTT